MCSMPCMLSDLTFFFGGFLLTGLVQGANWVNHRTSRSGQNLTSIRPYMATAELPAAILLVVSFFLFTYNIFATIIKREKVVEPEIEKSVMHNKPVSAVN